MVINYDVSRPSERRFVCEMFRGIVAALVLLLTSCGGGGPTVTPVATPTQPPSPTPTSVTTETAVTASATATQIRTDSPTPIVTAAGPPCRTSQLEAAFASVNGAAGTLIFIFEFRNTSDATCYLSGYASVALQDEYGDAI